MRRYALTSLLFLSVLLLTGCLLTVNHPRLAPDGTMAVFLESDGGYTLFPETGVLHLLQDGVWIPAPAATLDGNGGLLDLSPDGTKALYVETGSEGLFEPTMSTLYQVTLEPAAVPIALWETEDSVAKAVWTEDRRILLIAFDDEDLGALLALDPVTGETERLTDGLLSFETLPNSDEVIVLVGDDHYDLSLGWIARWDPATDTREALAAFFLNDATVELYSMLPHEFLWDVSPDGAWIALCLNDSALLEPTIESEMPSLYLVDVAEGTAERPTVSALMPAFNPDGTGFVYAVEGDDETAVLMWRDLASEEAEAIPGTEGVSSAFWLSSTRLGMTFELDGNRYRLVEFDVTTGESHELIGLPPEISDES